MRTRLSTRNPGEITGYAVALPGDTTPAGNPVWYSGGKLAADLTLPKLRHRWHGAAADPNPTRGTQLTWAERNAIWEHAARIASQATTQIRQLAVADPTAAADAAWAAADTLRAADAVLGSRILRRAADSYDRAARVPYGRIPRPSPTGTSLRRAGRLLSALGVATHDPSMWTITLVLRLAALTEAVADLRQTQQHAAQAAAARTAAERLRSVTRQQSERQRGTRPRNAADLARMGFPSGFRPQAPTPQNQNAPSSVHGRASPQRRAAPPGRRNRPR
ncbi:MAG: hypothetical protein ACM3ML_10720 [Micromonosporaceae bacterium]